MKLSIFSLISLATAVNGFSTTPISARRNFGIVTTSTSVSAETVSTGEDSIYTKLGFGEDKIAIGIEPKDVLEYLGTRKDLIIKFESDNPKFDLEQATEEVDRFMLDGEMVAKYIAFEKKKREPASMKAEAEANLSDPKTWGIYAAWITGGAGFAYVKNTIINPRYESGEWEEIHIKLPNWFGPADAGADAVTQAVDAVDTSAVVDAVQTVTEAL